MRPETLIRRRRYGTPSYTGGKEAEELLAAAEDAVLRRQRRPIDPNFVIDPSTLGLPPANDAGFTRTSAQVGLPDVNDPGFYISPDKFDSKDEPLMRRRTIGTQPVSTTISPEMADQSVIVRRPNVLGPDENNVIQPELDTTLERPRRTQPRDMVADLTSYRREVEANPEKLSRKRALLVGLLQGLAAGAQNGIGGMLGGAATGAITGAISPNTISRFRNQGKLAEIDRDINSEVEREGALARIDYMRQRPAIQQQQMEQRAASQRSLSMSRKQAALLRQLSLQGKYKRGENPALDAQIDEADLEISDFDKSKNEGPRIRSGDGYLWTVDEAGNPTPWRNPNNGQQMRSEAAIGRETTASTQGVRQSNDINADLAEASQLESQADELESRANSLPTLGTTSTEDVDLRDQAATLRRRAGVLRARAGSQQPITRSTPRTSGVSESQIRDEAKRRGLDPDEAVKRARNKGIL